jgi:PAS domain S-box-containing protein
MEVFWQLIHPEDRGRVRAETAMRSYAKAWHPIEGKCRLLLPDGAVKYVLNTWNPVFDKEGELVEVIGTTVDVTERRRAEEELRESEERFRNMADTAPVMIWVSGPDKLCNYFNQQWLDFTGRKMQDELGNGWAEGVHAEDCERCLRTYNSAFDRREPFRMEYRLRRSDGQFRWIYDIGVPRFSPGGEVFLGYIGSCIDITDRKRAEQERERLRQLEADLAHTNRVSMMGELAASLAHEIKQPIAAAATNAQTSLRWLQREPPDIGEAREAVSRIVKDVIRAADIIDRNRALYRRDTPKREVVNLNKLIQEMIVLLDDAANRQSVSIRAELDEALPTMAADRVQLQQVLMNLMLNGIEAMKDSGGELTIRSEKTEDSQILISVNDVGVGLPAEKTEQIFDAFFTTKAQGTGMGLSISRRIIESHGGRLWSSANTGRGATFQFTLPIAPSTSSTSAG